MGDGKRGPTVKTTIVGGQPPGNERAPGGIPVGVEELLSMAAVEPEFAQALMERPEETIQASGVALTESEQAILKSVGPGNLAAMIDGVRGVMPDEQRRDFLGRSAAAVLLLASGVGSGAAACDWGMKATGSRPDPVEHKYPAPTGARPDPPNPPPAPKPDMYRGPIETGSRPDPPPAPEAVTGSRPDEPEEKPPRKPDAGRKRPQPTRGIRPDRPKPPQRPPLSRGTRPDKPRPKENVKDPFKE